jgi:hypothetical protein
MWPIIEMMPDNRNKHSARPTRSCARTIHDAEKKCGETQTPQLPTEVFSVTKKAAIKAASFVALQNSHELGKAGYGAVDGTRTRDPRRDRPVF